MKSLKDKVILIKFNSCFLSDTSSTLCIDKLNICVASHDIIVISFNPAQPLEIITSLTFLQLFSQTDYTDWRGVRTIVVMSIVAWGHENVTSVDLILCNVRVASLSHDFGRGRCDRLLE